MSFVQRINERYGDNVKYGLGLLARQLHEIVDIQNKRAFVFFRENNGGYYFENNGRKIVENELPSTLFFCKNEADGLTFYPADGRGGLIGQYADFILATNNSLVIVEVKLNASSLSEQRRYDLLLEAKSQIKSTLENLSSNGIFDDPAPTFVRKAAVVAFPPLFPRTNASIQAQQRDFTEETAFELVISRHIQIYANEDVEFIEPRYPNI